MKRIYEYKGFQVIVDLETEWGPGAASKSWRSPSAGFVALVSVWLAGATRPMVTPIRLTGDSHHPFATEGDALMAGYSAGQRVIDDTLVK